MVGLLYPDEGDVLVHGESVPGMRDDELFEMRKRFGVLFQDGALFGSMDLYDNVAFPLRQHTDKGEDEIEDIVMRRLREVGLEGSREKMPNELSGGMRKRAGFARALVLDPDIVLFDEPDSGLDPVRTALLCELIQEVHEENGGAYVVITHDIMSAKRVAEYIAVLWRGRIVESGPAGELFDSDNQFVRQFLGRRVAGPLGMEWTGAARRARSAPRGLAARRRPSAPPARRAGGARSPAGCCCAAGRRTGTRSCSRPRASSCPTTTSRSAGRRVGSRARASSSTDDNLAAVESGAGAVRAAARGHAAAVRLTSLSGVANRYVTLTPGAGAAR